MRDLKKNEHGYWEVRIRGTDGRLHSFSTHKRDKAEAKEAIKAARINELELIAEAGVFAPNVVSVLMTGKKMLIEDAIPPWSQWMKYDGQSDNSVTSATMWIRSWMMTMVLQRRPLMSISEKDIDPWLNQPRLDTKASTRRSMLSALRSFFKFCCAKGWSMGNPASLLRIDYSLMTHRQKETDKRPIFEEDEIKTLLDITAPNGQKPNPFWHAAIAIGRWTGLRLSDICCLEWDCLMAPGRIEVWTRKHDKRVSLELEPEQLRVAIAGIEKVDDQYLFPYQRQQALGPDTRCALSIAFLRLCRRAGIYNRSFHCLRATLATRLDQAGVNRERIKEILGHADVETTEGYIRP